MCFEGVKNDILRSLPVLLEICFMIKPSRDGGDEGRGGHHFPWEVFVFRDVNWTLASYSFCKISLLMTLGQIWSVMMDDVVPNTKSMDILVNAIGRANPLAAREMDGVEMLQINANAEVASIIAQVSPRCYNAQKQKQKQVPRLLHLHSLFYGFMFISFRSLQSFVFQKYHGTYGRKDGRTDMTS